MNDEKFTSKKCVLCNHDDREKIESLILEGELTQKQISADFNISEQIVSNHKNKHMLSNVREHLQRHVQNKIMSGSFKNGNLGEIVRVLEYLDDNGTKCESCELKNRVEFIEKKINSKINWLKIGKWLRDENYQYPELEEAIEKIQLENNI